MNKPALAIFTIVAIAAMMGVSSVVPAFAAQKIVDEEDKKSFDATMRNVCGLSSVNAEFKIKSHRTIWDNDKYKFHQITLIKFTDKDTGELVGTSSSASNDQGTFGDGPSSFQNNFKIICTNGEDNTNNHFGITFHKDGSFNFHVES